MEMRTNPVHQRSGGARLKSGGSSGNGAAGGSDPRTGSSRRARQGTATSVATLLRADYFGELDVRFRKRVFFFELTLHIFAPVSLLFMGWSSGYTRLRNQMLLPGAALSSIIPWTLLTIVHIGTVWLLLAAVMADAITRHHSALPATIAVASAVSLTRVAMIAVKYAYMPPGRYAAMGSLPWSAGRSLNTAEMLSSGFWNPTTDFLHQELARTAERHGVDLETAHFQFSKEQAQPLEMLAKHDGGGSSSDHKQLTHDIGTALETCRQGQPGRLKVATVVAHLFCTAQLGTPALTLQKCLTLLMAIMQLVAVLLPYTMSTEALDWPARCILAACAYIILLSYQPLCFFFWLRFTQTGVNDYRRQSVVLNELTQLAQPKTARVGPTGIKTVIPPVINMLKPHNALAWVQARILALDLGRRYRLRVQIFISFVFVIVTCTLAAAYFQVAGMRAEQMLSTVEWTLINTGIVNALGVLFLIAAACVYGHMANDAATKQAEMCMDHAFRVEQRVATAEHELDAAERSKVSATVQTLQLVAERVRTYQAANPITLIGVTANMALLQACLTLGVSGTMVAVEFVSDRMGAEL